MLEIKSLAFCQAFFITAKVFRKGEICMGKLMELVRLLNDLKSALEILMTMIDSLEDVIGTIDNNISK